MRNTLKNLKDYNSTDGAIDVVNDAAKALVILNLKDDKCTQAVNYIESYSLDLASFEAKDIFECFIRTSRFTRAKMLSEKKLESKNLKERFEWLQNYMLAEFRLKKYASVLEVGADVQKLAKSLKTNPRHESMSNLFFANMNLNKLNDALKVAKDIEKSWPKEFKNIDIYTSIVKKALDDRNDLLLSEYAKKIIALQNSQKKYVQTPFVEFSYIGALKRLGKEGDALKVAQDLLDKKISDKDKTRAFYNAGEISLKLKKSREAKSYFEQCEALKVDSSWKDICKENLKLL